MSNPADLAPTGSFAGSEQQREQAVFPGLIEGPYRVLLADDEKTIVLSTSRLLEKRGWECTCVSDADAATERLCQEYFDVLVADYKMPGNEDLQLLQSGQGKGDFPDVPVIIITGYPSLRSAVTSVRLEAFDYITKPLDMEYLVKRIEEAAQQRRLKETIQRNEEFFHMVADFTYDWEDWIAPDG